MANTLVTVRCPDNVLKIIDEVCSLYGFSRSELMRLGALNYCQQILATDALDNLNKTCRALSEQCDNKNIDMSTVQELEALVDSLFHHLGLE